MVTDFGTCNPENCNISKLCAKYVFAKKRSWLFESPKKGRGTF